MMKRQKILVSGRPRLADLEQREGLRLGLQLPVFHTGESCQRRWLHAAAHEVLERWAGQRFQC